MTLLADSSKQQYGVLLGVTMRHSYELQGEGPARPSSNVRRAHIAARERERDSSGAERVSLSRGS